mmetsp:Transcript_19560/g.58931  ORF Transcript_19560/g.58931 Transcript_19560/m.58931 type:complete len:261 (-) Transcript_19560:696-1478(-)
MTSETSALSCPESFRLWRRSISSWRLAHSASIWIFSISPSTSKIVGRFATLAGNGERPGLACAASMDLQTERQKAPSAAMRARSFARITTVLTSRSTSLTSPAGGSGFDPDVLESFWFCRCLLLASMVSIRFDDRAVPFVRSAISSCWSATMPSSLAILAGPATSPLESRKSFWAASILCWSQLNLPAESSGCPRAWPSGAFGAAPVRSLCSLSTKACIFRIIDISFCTSASWTFGRFPLNARWTSSWESACSAISCTSL